MASASMLDFGYYAFSDIIDVLQIKAVTFPPNLVYFGRRNGISFSKSKMAVGAILKSTLLVEPPLLVIYVVFSMYKGSLLSGRGSNICYVSTGLAFGYNNFTTSHSFLHIRAYCI